MFYGRLTRGRERDLRKPHTVRCVKRHPPTKEATMAKRYIIIAAAIFALAAGTALAADQQLKFPAAFPQFLLQGVARR